MQEGTVVDGRYRVVRRLGEGAFGEVLEAVDENLQRPVALKLLKVSVADEDLRRRFDREARVTAGLGHPHVVTLYGHGVTPEGRPYLAYELLEGEDLESRMGQGGVSEEDAFRWGGEVAGALHAAHQQGVIHRDVKPANVFLKQGDVAVLCDFGIARDSSGATALTSEGVLLGTPAYMSPELWRGHTPGPASDQWAWAASLFEMVYRQTPYPGPSPREIMEQALDGVPIRIPAGYEGRSPGLEAVLLRALAPRPEDRYPDMAAFAQALREAARGSLQDVLLRSGVALRLPVAAKPERHTVVVPKGPAPAEDSGAFSTPTRVAGERRRIPRWALVVSASALMVLGFVMPGTRPPAAPAPSAAPAPGSATPTEPAPVRASPAVLDRLAPLRAALQTASRELRRMAGFHPSQAMPDRIARLTFHKSERLDYVDPVGVGKGILEDDTRIRYWHAYLEALGAWLGALADEQARSKVPLCQDPAIEASLDALVYQPLLRILEVAHLDYWHEFQDVGVVYAIVQKTFVAMGPAYEEMVAGIESRWPGNAGLPPALKNLRDLGRVMGRVVWGGKDRWDATDRAEMIRDLASRVRAARPGPVGAMTLRLALYHLCLTAIDRLAPWSDREALLAAVVAKVVDDPAWSGPALDPAARRGLVARAVIEEVRQRRIHDSPTEEAGFDTARTERVFRAFEAAWEEDPELAAHAADMGWRVAEWAGSVGFYNKDRNPRVLAWRDRLAAVRAKVGKLRKGGG